MNKKFKITVLGSGGAFATMEQGNSAFLVEYKERRILIDCGMTVPYVLRDEMNIPLQSITDIILTHCHSDHSGGVEMVLHACRWLGKGHKPCIWGSKWVLASLFHALRILSYEKGTDTVIHPSVKHYWEHPVDSEQTTLLGLCLQTQSVAHVGAMPTTSVRWGPLFISGDTNSPVSIPDDVSLIFHEAEFGFATGVHCPVSDLVEHCKDDSLRGKEIWAYHCPQDSVAPGPLAGILRKGQVFEIEIP